jgi:6-phosphogluconolactonase
MKTFLSSLVIGIIAFACSSPKTAEETQETMSTPAYSFILGSYTNDPSHGIYLVDFDPEANTLEVKATASEPENPSFVAVNTAQNRVYSVEETGGEDGGKVSAFKLERGTFEKINTVSAKGNGPCYVTLDPSERFVVVANYGGGNFSVIPVNPDGGLADAIQSVNHKGNSVNPRRQDKPYVHSAVFHPSDSRLLIADLGTDEVVVYDFDATQEKPLTEKPASRLKVTPGAGPRHMVFNKAGDRLYLIHEITAAVGVYAYEDGTLTHIETQTLVRDGFEGNVGAAEVRISEDGKFLYASNRGDANELIAFEITDEGKLTHIQTISSGGMAPRNFNLTPDGKYLLAGNQGSNTLLVFSRNQETGEITPTDIKLDINKPVYIRFLE